MSYIKDPMAIEKSSFEIIDGILEEMGLSLESKSPVERAIFHRVIHTSADFDYVEQLKISPAFIEAFSKALSKPVRVYTDTTMVLSGINKTAFSKTPWSLKCLVAEEEAKALALEKGITRSMAAVQLALETPGDKLFVIGNAPTAIFQLVDLGLESRRDIIGVIGVPVGFVGALESKQLLYEMDIPSIVALGRKGGSNVAASIINALLYAHVGR